MQSDPDIESREPREIGLVVMDLTTPGAVSHFLSETGWTTDPRRATVYLSEAAADAAALAAGTVRSLRENGDVWSLDRFADLYGDDPDVDDADAPF